MRVRLRGKFPRGAGEVAAVSRRKGRARRVGGRRPIGFAVPLAERHKRSSTVGTAKEMYQASGTRSARYLAYRTLLSRIGSFLTRRSCACNSRRQWRLSHGLTACFWLIRRYALGLYLCTKPFACLVLP